MRTPGKKPKARPIFSLDPSDTGGVSAPLDPDEWDFRGVGEDELMTVLIYEYTRSAPLARQLIEAWQAQPFGAVHLNDLAPFDEDQKLCEVIKQAPDFTVGQAVELSLDSNGSTGSSEAKSQLSYHLDLMASTLLPPADRQIAVRFTDLSKSWPQIRRSPSGADYLRAHLLPTISRQGGFMGDLGPRHTYEHLLKAIPTLRVEKFLIDLTVPLNDLVAAFRMWARDHRAEPGVRTPERRGRKANLEKLKFLSAYRLRGVNRSYRVFRKTVDDRIKETKSLQVPRDVLPEYFSQTSWIRAAENAERLLSGDFGRTIRQSFGLINFS